MTIVLHHDRPVMDTTNPLLILREIRSDRATKAVTDKSGHLYQVWWTAAINIKKFNPLANPDKDEVIASAPTELLRDNHMYPRCLASFRDFFSR